MVTQCNRQTGAVVNTGIRTISMAGSDAT